MAAFREELHDWIDQSIGVQYGRKVRATLCCRVTPDSMAYGGANVINGISRTENWPNLWISDPLRGFPQDLTLSWDSARTISEIRLTFDTDLCAPDRVCGFPREQFRFVFPVPECVRDYRILKHEGEGWYELISVEGNYHRRRIHRLKTPIETKALRVEVLSAHGAETARIYEIRVY